MTEALYRWSMWATPRPKDQYYYTNWDRKQQITVIAATRQEAINAADTALGDAGPDRYWVFRVRDVVDCRIPEAGGHVE